MDCSKYYRARRSVDGLTGSAGRPMVRSGVTANREVSAGETYKLDAKVIDLIGTDSITLRVGQSSIKIDDEGITLVSADGQRIKLKLTRLVRRTPSTRGHRLFRCKYPLQICGKVCVSVLMLP
jgi:hypothetical protein